MTLHDEVASQLPWPLPGREVPDAEAEVEALAADARAVDRSKAIAQLAGWLELVKMWNRKIDLTAAKTDPDLVELGIQDATQIAGRIARDGGGVIDVGSGFGSPGLAVAILRPDLEVKLAEPLKKRATFLRTVIGSLGLTARVEVLETRGEDVVDAGMKFDAAISRATLSPTAWLALGDQLAPAGEVVVLLARDPEPSLPNRTISWRATYETRAGAPRVAIGLRTG